MVDWMLSSLGKFDDAQGQRLEYSHLFTKSSDRYPLADSSTLDQLEDMQSAVALRPEATASKATFLGRLNAWIYAVLIIASSIILTALLFVGLWQCWKRVRKGLGRGPQQSCPPFK